MIYDCFTFFNELDLLEIRLNVLRDAVDKFVLVEKQNIKAGDMKKIQTVINDNADIIIKRWKEYFEN